MEQVSRDFGPSRLSGVDSARFRALHFNESRSSSSSSRTRLRLPVRARARPNEPPLERQSIRHENVKGPPVCCFYVADICARFVLFGRAHCKANKLAKSGRSAALESKQTARSALFFGSLEPRASSGVSSRKSRPKRASKWPFEAERVAPIETAAALVSQRASEPASERLIRTSRSPLLLRLFVIANININANINNIICRPRIRVVVCCFSGVGGTDLAGCWRPAPLVTSR